jgi:hypothetical protein
MSTSCGRRWPATRSLFLLAACALALCAAPPALAQSGAITGVIFADGNANGVHDPGEQGVPNVAFTFSGVGDPVSGVTNADGSYFFTANLGAWTMTVTPPAGFEVVNGPSQTVTIAAAEQSITLDFGLKPVQTVTDTPPPPGPTATPGILPTTGAPAAPRPVLMVVLGVVLVAGAVLLLSAFRRRQTGA